MFLDRLHLHLKGHLLICISMENPGAHIAIFNKLKVPTSKSGLSIMMERGGEQIDLRELEVVAQEVICLGLVNLL